jgi:predicted 2-oxoglutarate/Fe(II)-dependent dioxygenase YbiX
MFHAELFAKLGVLIVPDFVPLAECARLRAEMKAAPHTAALLSLRGRSTEVVDSGRRKTSMVRVSDETYATMVSRLLTLKPTMESFFASPLAGVVEAPKFLIYREGDFFVPHRDVGGADDDARAPIINARRINLIVSLNAQSDSPDADGYCGAALTLYGLIDQPRWRTYGFPVPAAPGSLVAFRSDVIHEVAPITRGERYSVVSRMLDPSFEAQSATPCSADDPQRQGGE